jgi:hypothetical protein
MRPQAVDLGWYVPDLESPCDSGLDFHTICYVGALWKKFHLQFAGGDLLVTCSLKLDGHHCVHRTTAKRLGTP